MAEVKTLLAEGMDHGRSTSWPSCWATPTCGSARRPSSPCAAQAAAAIADARSAGRSRANRPLARLHAIWGLGQVGPADAAALETAMVALLDDADAEVRAQAARVLGEARWALAAFDAHWRGLARRPSPRVRFFAAIALGKLGRAARLGPLARAAPRATTDDDPYLRHAAVMGLTGIGDRSTCSLRRPTPRPRSALGVLLALRRLEQPEVARFLDDPEPPARSLEAARAINDVPIDGGAAELAALAEPTERSSEPLAPPGDQRERPPGGQACRGPGRAGRAARHPRGDPGRGAAGPGRLGRPVRAATA